MIAVLLEQPGSLEGLCLAEVPELRIAPGRALVRFGAYGESATMMLPSARLMDSIGAGRADLDHASDLVQRSIIETEAETSPLKHAVKVQRMIPERQFFGRVLVP